MKYINYYNFSTWKITISFHPIASIILNHRFFNKELLENSIKNNMWLISYRLKEKVYYYDR